MEIETESFSEKVVKELSEASIGSFSQRSKDPDLYIDISTPTSVPSKSLDHLISDEEVLTLTGTIPAFMSQNSADAFVFNSSHLMAALEGLVTIKEYGGKDHSEILSKPTITLKKTLTRKWNFSMEDGGLNVLGGLAMEYSSQIMERGISITRAISPKFLKDVVLFSKSFGERSLTEFPDDLLQFFKFRNYEKVVCFLSGNSYLISLLQEAREQIYPLFPNAQLFLEVISDPEWTANEQLVLFISVDSNPETAAENLEIFDTNWWLENLEKSHGKLCISLEFL